MSHPKPSPFITPEALAELRAQDLVLDLPPGVTAETLAEAVAGWTWWAPEWREKKIRRAPPDRRR